VNFTGYACANCHWMESNMFPKPEIASGLKNFVLVDLYTDGTDQASEENQKLELAKFNTIATPFYAIVDANENVIATFADRTTDAKVYRAFLDKGAAVSPPAPVAPAVASSETPAPAAGDTATLPTKVSTLQGSPLDTKGFGGKVVVVNFWATWCVPCVQEIPGFNKLHHDYGSKGVVVLGVSMDEEGAEKVRPFLTKHPMDYTVGVGPQTFFDQYGIQELPVTVVFDRSGKPLKRFEGFTQETQIEAAVKQAL
jgi:thiol:disulfide interchange protein DsbD